MATEWPADLPQCLQIGGYSEDQQPVTIRSSVEVGAAKLRRRYTRPIINISAQLVVTKEELIRLREFFDVDLQGGTQPFTMTRPTEDSPEDFRFLKPPGVSSLTDIYFTANLEFERI